MQSVPLTQQVSVDRKLRIAVVSDDRDWALRIAQELHCVCIASLDAAVFSCRDLDRIVAERDRVDGIMIGRLPETVNIDSLVADLREAWPRCPLIAVVPDGEIRTGLSAVAAGADDFALDCEATGSALARRVVSAFSRRTGLHVRIEQLSTRNEELDSFAHTVAHDLKNPLALMTTTARVLEDQLELLRVEDLRKHLRVISRTGRQMCDVIDALLLLASMRRLEIRSRPVRMHDVLDKAIKRLGPMLDESEAEVVMPDRWPSVIGYAPWIEEVWVNLLDNALRYGGDPPHIRLGWQLEGGEACFSVWDNGRGLSVDEQRHLFEAFPQAGRQRGKGHGLGLVIVRDIVHKLEGQVGVDSVVGEGSRFFFTLPLAETESQG